MSKATNSTVPPRSRRLFALTAAIYTVGVVAFSTWSYFQQRANLLAQVDESLINATHATEQILGGIFIACAVETETVYEPGYASNQEKLDRFADDCHIDLLGAMGRKGAKTWMIIIGNGSNESITASTDRFRDIPSSELSSMVRTLAHSEEEGTRMKTMEFEEYGKLRIAIRYHPLSSDTGYAILAARSTRNVNQLIRALALHTAATGVFLYAMAFPLIVLYNRTQAKSARKMVELNARLQQDVIKQKDREAELEDAIRDLGRFNDVAVGRENRVIELKAEVNTLLKQMNRPKRYMIDHIE